MASTDDKGSEKTLFDMPFYWREAGLNRATKNIRFVGDGEGGIWAYPTLLVGVNPARTEIRVNSIGKANTDALDPEQTGITVRNVNYVYNRALDTFERLRTPGFFKEGVADAGAGSYDVWTPTAGKKFRLMGGVVTVACGLAAAGKLTIDIQEETLGSTGIKFRTYAPIAASITGVANVIPFNLPGNGYLSTTVSKKLQLVTDVAITAGWVGIAVWGTEE